MGKTKCVCKNCNKEFEIPTAWLKKGAGKTCSRECAAKIRLGIKHPANKRVKLICRICNTEYEVKAYREKNSKTCSNKCRQELYRKTMIGENAGNWRGGVSKQRDIDKRTKEYKEWRAKVYEQDNYTCRACNDSNGSNLHAHHIENYSSKPELRFSISNGITLCNNCHNPSIKGSFHYIYGTRNNTREQLAEFILNLNGETYG